ncbi:MAG TPA: ABC transporter substrate-binding protein [Gemmatimonadales bacterium]|nr:ABC transporter substrate-binding protein [Candidatus Bathyarchaeia archaeon]HUL01803.1 ABC transporter substrate-binding protein [Gemmatimonadales bacterium]
MQHYRGRPAAVALAAIILTGIGPSPAVAQRAHAPYRIGVLNDAPAANHPAVHGLKTGLAEGGMQDGRDVVYDVKLTDGSPEQMRAAAEALVRSGVDVIFTSGEAATLTAKAATQAIPIVFTLVGDPIAAGVVKALAQPAGNVTGVSSLTSELVPKRLEALRALAPTVRRVWAISHSAGPLSGVPLDRALAASARLGLELAPRTIRTSGELDQTLDSFRPGDGLLVPDVAVMDISARLLEVSLARRIPAAFSSDLWVNHGGLVSYGADYRAQGVQASRLVQKVLRGAHPRDLPVEGAERIILAVNLKTVAAFGLTAPRQILFRADVIRR